MKQADIKIGGTYRARVSGALVNVRVDAERKQTRYKGQTRTVFDCTNLRTGKKLIGWSAAKFRFEVKPDDEQAEARRRAAEKRDADYDRATVSAVAHDERQEVDFGGFRPNAGGEQRPDPRQFEERFPGLAAKAKAVAEAAAATSAPTAPATSVVDRDAAIRAWSANGMPAVRPEPSLNALLAARTGKAEDRSPHLIVEARAGTGKTTTLVSALQRLKGIEPLTGNGAPMVPSPQQAAVWDAVCKSPKDSSVTFVAFNKSIATELQRRVPPGCSAMTMHSLGFRAVTKALGRLEPTEWASVDLIASLAGTDAREMRKKDPVVLKATEQLVSLCKMNLTEPTPENLDRLASHYDVDLDRFRSRVFDLVPRVLDAARDPKGKITFDDMIWLPVALGLPVPQSDLLLVDEAQDLNRCQQALAKVAGRRLVFCGDPRQAIYGFAGADNESMQRLEAELRGPNCDRCEGYGLLNEDGKGWPEGTECPSCRGFGSRGCEHLPLTVTRRCGKAIVREAQRWVPDFEAHESNPEGKISEANYPWRKTADGGVEVVEFARTYAADCRPGDMVLCRTNAPLVKNCFAFIKRGVKANIQGRDVGRGLTALVSKLTKDEPLPTAQLVGRLSDWLTAETAKEQAKRNPSENKLTALEDRYSCLMAFTEGAATAADVTRRIEGVFTDDKHAPGVRLSSIHKAKGLEADRVFWLRPPGVGMREDKMQPWEREQERNLDYVCTTRAIHELVHVS